MRSMVDLPEPDGPSSARISPGTMLEVRRRDHLDAVLAGLRIVFFDFFSANDRVDGRWRIHRRCGRRIGGRIRVYGFLHFRFSGGVDADEVAAKCRQYKVAGWIWDESETTTGRMRQGRTRDSSGIHSTENPLFDLVLQGGRCITLVKRSILKQCTQTI